MIVAVEENGTGYSDTPDGALLLEKGKFPHKNPHGFMGDTGVSQIKPDMVLRLP